MGNEEEGVRGVERGLQLLPDKQNVSNFDLKLYEGVPISLLPSSPPLLSLLTHIPPQVLWPQSSQE